MEEKKVIKISLKSFIIIFLIIMICVGGFIVYIVNSGKDRAKDTNEVNTVKNINEENTLNNTNKNIAENESSSNKNENNNVTTTNIDNAEIGKEIKERLSNEEGNKIYKKAIFSRQFLSILIENKDTLNSKFSDEEIVKLLVEIDESKDKSKIFKDASNQSGFYVEASIDDVQKMSQKYFGKTINPDTFKGKEENKIIMEVQSGFGILVDKFIAGYKMDNGDYFLTLEPNTKEIEAVLKKIKIAFEKTDSIVYKGFTSDITKYVSVFNSKNNN